MKNNQTLGIGVLSITALILFIAQFLPIQRIAYGEALKDRDFSLLTAKSARGGDTIYVLDNRTGIMAAFVWEPTQRAFQLVGARPVSEAFQ